MSKQNCKAKNPYYCRFHGPKVYQDAQDQINFYRGKLATATKFEEIEALYEGIKDSEIKRDASAKGFAKLSKELTKALKGSNLEVQARLTYRLNRAAEVRLKDGVTLPWGDDTISLDEVVIPKIIEESEKNTGVVSIPFRLTGTPTIASLAAKMNAKGYRLLDISLYSWDSNSLNESKEAQRIELQKKAVDYIKRSDGSLMYSLVSPAGFYANSFTFLNRHGKRTTLVADGSVDEKEDKFYLNK